MKYEIMPASSPETQCQSNDSRGQCTNETVKGSKYCPVHGGRRNRTSHLYELKKNEYRVRIKNLKDHEEAKSLRTEIGVLRLILESRLNGLEDDTQLLLQQQSISDLIIKINTLVTSCHKIETHLSNILTSDQAAQMINEICDIIDELVEDQDTKMAIAERIDTLLEQKDEIG